MTLLMIGGSEIIFIVLLVLLLFGGRKIPELMRGIGKGMRSFKEGMNGVDEPQSSEKQNVTKPENAEKQADNDAK